MNRQIRHLLDTNIQIQWTLVHQRPFIHFHCFLLLFAGLFCFLLTSILLELLHAHNKLRTAFSAKKRGAPLVRRKTDAANNASESASRRLDAKGIPAVRKNDDCADIHRQYNCWRIWVNRKLKSESKKVSLRQRRSTEHTSTPADPQPRTRPGNWDVTHTHVLVTLPLDSL